MFRRFGVVLGLLLVFVASPATRADDANRECDNDQDVTLVVDFQNLGGGVNVRCASQPVGNGFDVFKNANVSYDQYQGFVCRIAGRPESEQCNRYPPSDAYWVYWYATRGGEWKYSNYGAGARKPPPGSADGWTFFLKQGENDKPTPPRYPVPGPIAHATTTVTAAFPTSSPGPTPTTRVRSSSPSGASTTHTVAPTTTELPVEFVGEPATTSTTEKVPFGDVDLSVDHGDGGTSKGFIASAVGVAGLAAAGFVFLRLRGR